MKFFKKIGSSYTQQNNKPGYISALSKPSADKVTDLFIENSSLHETLNQFQRQRMIKETKDSNINISEILDKELETTNILEKNYMTLKSIFLTIQKDNNDILQESVNMIQNKIIQIDKRIESLHEHQRYLRLLINQGKENKKLKR